MKITEKQLRINEILFVKKGKTPISSYPAGPRNSDCFVYVLTGTGYYTFNGVRYVAEADDVIFLSHGSRYHVEIPRDDFTYFFVDFSFEGSDNGVMENEIYKNERLCSLAPIFARLEKNYHRGSFAEKIESMSLLYQIYSSITAAFTAEYLPSGRREKITRAAEYMRENFAKPDLTVEWLADFAGISTVHFRRIFERVYGVSPKKYIISLKLSRARELLSSTDMKISQIAETVGFENAYYFSKVMREQTGMTPTEMRKTLTPT